MELMLREVTRDDCNLLFKWSNDELVRKNSFNTKRINYNDHIKWFNNKLNDDNNYMYILCFENIDIGIVRLSIEKNIGFIGYSIDNKHRGHGYSISLINLLECKIMDKKLPIKMLKAYVKNDNIISQKVFKKCNYLSSTGNKNFIEFYKIV